MSVLLTGGAGFIGSHCCVELLEKGEDIILLDNFSNSGRDVPAKLMALTGREFAVCETDLLDPAAIDECFVRYGVESVIHFAGLKAVGESVSLPLRYYQNNVTGTLNLLSAMARHGCKRIVFSSSATVYGESQDVPFTEDSPLSATNPYGWTKVFIERMLTDLQRSDSSWSVALLRYFNPIGAHPSGVIGENPAGKPNNLLPYIMKVATGELPFLEVFGDDYNTPDGTGVRDYIHVCDLASGHLAALYRLREADSSAEPLILNLGTGQGHSVLEVLKAAEKAVGRALPYRISPRRPGDIAASYASTDRARRILGWSARHSLEEMCRDSWRFILKNRT